MSFVMAQTTLQLNAPSSMPPQYPNPCPPARPTLQPRERHSTKNETRALKLWLKRLESKLSELVERNGVILEEELSADMCKLMDENDIQVQEEYKEDTFHNIFWKQQREAMGREGVKRNGIRWHPLMIKWCLYLRHQSSKAYDTIRESGCIALPSQRTLRDYLHAVKIGAGFGKVFAFD